MDQTSNGGKHNGAANTGTAETQKQNTNFAFVFYNRSVYVRT